jgi:hypothetical protein
MGEFEEWCRERGGQVVERGEDMHCRISPDQNVETDDEMSLDRSVSKTTSSLSLAVVLLGIIAVAASAFTKIWAVSTALRGSTGPISMDVAVATLVPFVGPFLVDVPLWVTYVSVWSWIGVLATITMVLVYLMDMGLIAGFGSLFLIMFSVANALISALWAGALALIPGFQMVTFAKIYILTRIGVLSVPAAIWGQSVFDFGQILWLGIVIWWIIFSAGTIFGGNSTNRYD